MIAEFLDALCALVADLRPDLEWHADGSSYGPGVMGIYWDETPPDVDSSVTVNEYGVRDDPYGADDVVGVQFRYRAYPGTGLVRQTRDSVFDLLQGMSAVTIGGVRVISVSRNSSVKLGQDSTGRADWADSFYFAIHRPGPNRF